MESDSLLAVRKITSTVADTDPLCNILRSCQELLSRNWHCSLVHVYREMNSCADHFAHLAFEGPHAVTKLSSPPGSLVRLLNEDLVGVARPRAVVS